MITYNINKNDNIQKSDAQEIYDSICKYYRISYHTKILISHVLKKLKTDYLNEHILLLTLLNINIKMLCLLYID